MDANKFAPETEMDICEICKAEEVTHYTPDDDYLWIGPACAAELISTGREVEVRVQLRPAGS